MSALFVQKTLSGTLAITAPTALQWGPDGKLYVTSRSGLLDVVTVQKVADGTYSIVSQSVVDIIRSIPNHDDDGAYNPSILNRQVTGLAVAGTAANPVIYISSSDPRNGGGSNGTDSNLDTNSGTISRLAFVNDQWEKVDIVRGLPRSEADHSTNGLAISSDGTKLLVAQGGNTNAGAPAAYFAGLNDYALSGAILTIDLQKIAQIEQSGTKTYSPAAGVTQHYVYDLPTLDDPTRSNSPDGLDLPGRTGAGGDPFGGNDGLNMARLVPDGPVQILMSGFRNPYDVLVTQDGRAWSYDNGPSSSQGGPTLDQHGARFTGAEGQIAVNLPNENNFGVINNTDQLHELVTGGYAGTPNLIRAFGADAGLLNSPAAGTSGATLLPAGELPRDLDQAVAGGMLDRRQAEYLEGGVSDGAVDSGTGSTNGLAEYTSATLISDGTGGVDSLKGAMLATNFQQGQLLIIDRFADGDGDVETSFSSGKAVADGRQVISLGGRPLGIDALGDGGPFAGTIWVTMLSTNRITILEPGQGSQSPPFDLSLSSSLVAETADNGTSVGFLVGKDNDGAAGLTYKLTEDGGGLFRLEANTGELFIADTSLLNYDQMPIVKIAAEVRDPEGHSYSETFSVVVTAAAKSLTGTSDADRLTASDDKKWIINGLSGNDVLAGRGGADQLNGGDNDDRLIGGGGDDLVNGGFGVDTLVLSGGRSDYSFTSSGSSVIVHDNRLGTPDGADTATAVERVEYVGGGLKPAGAVEATWANDALTASSAVDVFLFDTATGLQTGADQIKNLGAGDRIVTTSAKRNRWRKHDRHHCQS